MKNLIGYRVVLHSRYNGCKYGIIKEVLGQGECFGVWLAGYYYNNHPITVDFRSDELTIDFAMGNEEELTQ